LYNKIEKEKERRRNDDNSRLHRQRLCADLDLFSFDSKRHGKASLTQRSNSVGPTEIYEDIKNSSEDDLQDLVGALKMFYDHYKELRPDQQKRLMQMLGQDLDRPLASKPYVDWDEFQKMHDLPKSTHERFIYSAPYHRAGTSGAVR
jgi:hypothetical protein